MAPKGRLRGSPREDAEASHSCTEDEEDEASIQTARATGALAPEHPPDYPVTAGTHTGQGGN